MQLGGRTWGRGGATGVVSRATSEQAEPPHTRRAGNSCGLLILAGEEPLRGCVGGVSERLPPPCVLPGSDLSVRERTMTCPTYSSAICGVMRTAVHQGDNVVGFDCSTLTVWATNFAKPPRPRNHRAGELLLSTPVRSAVAGIQNHAGLLHGRPRAVGLWPASAAGWVGVQQGGRYFPGARGSSTERGCVASRGRGAFATPGGSNIEVGGSPDMPPALWHDQV